MTTGVVIALGKDQATMTATPTATPTSTPPWAQPVQLRLSTDHPEHADDIARGVAAAAAVYTGEPEAFAGLCAAHWVPPGPARQALLAEWDGYLEAMVGSLIGVLKATRRGMDVADRPLEAVDRLCAEYAPDAHVEEDLRATGMAAAIQLNFGGVPDDPADLTVRTPPQWAELALSRVGTELIPSDLRRRHTQARARSEALVQSYNFYLRNIRFPDPLVSFDEALPLISHWGLRDFMTNLNGSPNAVVRQRAILDLMNRVVRGQVPEAILDNPGLQWDVSAGAVGRNGHGVPAQGEGARRWRPFRETFAVQRELDRHTRRPNMIDTVFLERRRMPEQRVEAMLVALLSSPLIRRIARFVERRLGRPLEPFDIYFRRFQDEHLDTARLDGLVAGRYPTRQAIQADLARILEQLSFPTGDAAEIARHIRIDNARGAGHAWPPGTRDDRQLLRVRVGPAGLDWQEFGTFMHELGHCVEGVLSSYAMPYWLLWGVPNNAFTEAFAFTFQDLAVEVLGEATVRDLDVEMIQRVWEAFEIAGPALAEMRLFRWLYAHPEATAEEIHLAIQEIGDAMWAEFHAPVFGPTSYGQMSVYSHMLWCDAYLADYPMGHIIAYQVRGHLAAALAGGSTLADEMTRMCRAGSIYPDAWMMAAVGAPVRVEPMLEDAAGALDRLGL